MLYVLYDCIDCNFKLATDEVDNKERDIFDLNEAEGGGSTKKSTYFKTLYRSFLDLGHIHSCQFSDRFCYEKMAMAK